MPDDQSRASVADAAPGRRQRAFDEASRPALCPAREPELSAPRHAVGGALPLLPSRFRTLSARLPSLYRAQSSPGRHGQPPQDLPMVELPYQSRRQGERSDQTARSICSARPRSAASARSLSGAVPRRAGCGHRQRHPHRHQWRLRSRRGAFPGQDRRQARAPRDPRPAGTAITQSHRPRHRQAEDSATPADT